jgi:LPXTG-motif cell wall-anchored protein
MTKHARICLAAAGVAAALALPTAASAQAPRTVTVNLATQNASGVAGAAILTDMGGGHTQVVIKVSTGGNNAMPAHFHDGTCATLNPVPKIPLNTVTNGTSTSDVNMSIAQLLASPLAINLHKSAAEASVYTACGNVVATAAALPRTGGHAGFAAPLLAGAGAALAGLGGLIARRRRR